MPVTTHSTWSVIYFRVLAPYHEFITDVRSDAAMDASANSHFIIIPKGGPYKCGNNNVRLGTPYSTYELHTP